MKEHRIVIKPGGTVVALYADDIAALCASVGPMHVERASHVEYSAEHGGWYVQLPDHRLLCRQTVEDGHESSVRNLGPCCVWSKRSDALAAEVAYLEARL